MGLSVRRMKAIQNPARWLGCFELKLVSLGPFQLEQMGCD